MWNKIIILEWYLLCFSNIVSLFVHLGGNSEFLSFSLGKISLKYSPPHPKLDFKIRYVWNQRSCKYVAHHSVLVHVVMWHTHCKDMSQYMCTVTYYHSDCGSCNQTAGACPQQVKFTLPGYLFTHLGFPSVRAVLNITFIPGFVMIMD